MTADITRLREMRERAGRGAEPFAVGALSGPLYVGEPRWASHVAIAGLRWWHAIEVAPGSSPPGPGTCGPRPSGCRGPAR